MTMTRLPRAAAVAALLLAAACESAGTLPGEDGTAELRVFSAVYNASTARPGQRVDALVDGSPEQPGAAALDRHTATAYAGLEAGVHRFGARLAGDDRPAAQSALVTFDARGRALAGWSYTLFLVGTVPAFGAPTVQPILVSEDPFAPSPGSARIRVVNAAPYAVGSAGTGAQLRVYLLPGSQPLPTSYAALAPLFTIGYRQASPDVEVAPGTYRVAIVRTNGSLLASDTVQLAAGSRRTAVAVSTGPAATPAPANHRVLRLTDRETPR
ncbi:MAG TPA: DUF4397 domain-containing protein [Longimicrobium sp.]|nr:DUF4397 domain-containing protein [Longimicrobium sp.]